MAAEVVVEGLPVQTILATLELLVKMTEEDPSAVGNVLMDSQEMEPAMIADPLAVIQTPAILEYSVWTSPAVASVVIIVLPE